MKKFKRHSVFSAGIVFLVLVDCLIELYVHSSLSTLFEMKYDFDFYRAIFIVLLLALGVISSALVFLKYVTALKLCLFCYLIQTLGVIHNEVYIILSYGLWISWSIPIASFSLEVNLVALGIVALSILSLWKVNVELQIGER